jgi:hypothetical protein
MVERSRDAARGRQVGRALLAAMAALGASLLPSCEGPGRAMPAAAAPVTAAQTAPAGPWTPGLGELMTAIQLRHGKLSLAGAARNWPLAAYELDELQEGLADVQALHPVEASLPLPTTTLIPNLTHEALDNLRAAIAAKDSLRFDAGLESLTSSCNACHTLAKHEFIVIRRATGVPLGNQDFTPAAVRAAGAR